jgi:hypothetical protein
MCLLYGIYRAVTSPNLFAADNANTIFNFIALALYVLAVCVTSTLLARKRIIPDTTMLLLLHALLFISPFILFAHGVFLKGQLGEALGWGGMGCGLAQLYILRRRLPETFLSRPLLIGGAIILAANFAAPLIFRSGLDNPRNDNEIGGTVALYAWNLALPILAAWLNLLPTAEDGGRVAPRRAVPSPLLWTRPWFPFVIYTLWLAGSVVQLWTIAYVDDRSLHAYQFTAVAWILTWTLFNRAQLFPARIAARLEQFAPAATLLIPVLGPIAGLDLNIASVLFLLNIPISLLLRRRLPALALVAASLAGAACCMPHAWIGFLSPQTERLQFIAIILAAITLGGLAVLRDSRAGVLAALGLAISLAQFTNASAAAIINAAVLFLFLHQLRWNRIGPAESIALFAVGLCWMFATLTFELHGETTRAACMIATIICAVVLRHASLNRITSLIPPVCSIFILLIHPTKVIAHATAHAPSGVFAIVIGFLLLAAGAYHSLRQKSQRTS